MKLSLSWIRDYVELPKDFDLDRLSYDLTMSTVEVEGAEHLARRFDGMVVGVIKEVLPHPNADKLRVCRTDIGGEIKEIVCGGSNLYAGMKVAAALPGAVVRWHGEGDPVEIKQAKLRGVESYGMICASSEIGLGDLFPAAAEAEVVDLSSFEASAGTPLAEALGLDDIILEIDTKSMTNRPDLWGHYGIAREIAALYDLPLKDFCRFDPPADTGAFSVVIKDGTLCPRYIGVRIEGVAVKESDYLMKSRIWRVGMRPINALVDITNYVMLATGQPTHAFDADLISGGITVRRAGEGEKLLLLNGKDLSLRNDDLVIADDREAVALAGVMGGAKDSILPGTKRVILEVANFSAKSVRRTAMRYENRTEASSRYEKAIDTQRCDQALGMAMKLFREYFPGSVVSGFCDNRVSQTERKRIDVTLEWLERRLGKRIPNSQICDKLSRLGFEVCFADGVMVLAAPSWRSTGDISLKEDIMEEVARMYGYENFEPTPIATVYSGAINQLDKDLVRRIKEYLAFRCGMREVFTYPWMEMRTANAVLGSDAGVLKLSTPPSPDEEMIRSSLLPNLVDAAAKNERYYPEFSIFEESQVFFDRDYTSPYDETELLPLQRRHIAGAFAGAEDDVTNLFRKAKGIIEQMPSYVHMEAYSFAKEQKPVWSDGAVWFNFVKDGKVCGDFGLLDKKIAIECGVKNLAVILFELDLDCMTPFTSRTNGFVRPGEYPTVESDVSLLFDCSVGWKDIEAALLFKGNRDPLLKGAGFVDEYRGKQIPEGKKSVTIRLYIGSDERTLRSEEIEKSTGNAVGKLTHTLGAEKRFK